LEAGYTLDLTDVAEAVYRRLFNAAEVCLKRGDRTNSKVKQFRIVDDVLDRIIPHHPFAPERALSGSLSGIYRVKKGRLRICYVADSKLRRITVLYISDSLRKHGDSHDPYRVLTKLVRSGKFDALFRRNRD